MKQGSYLVPQDHYFPKLLCQNFEINQEAVSHFRRK